MRQRDDPGSITALDDRPVPYLARDHRVDPMTSTGPALALSLQRSAGNQAVAGLLAAAAAAGTSVRAAAVRPPLVQRCGPVPCDCSDEERETYDREHGTGSAVQRDCDPATQSCPPVDQGPSGDVSALDQELIAELARIDASRPVSDPAYARALARSVPMSAVVGGTPVAYAGLLAVGPGVSAGPPAGLLATEALAGQGIAAAQGIAASQGVAATTTAVVEGSTLGSTLVGAGEGLLAIEAAGGAEIEAATGPPGWIVGAVVLLAAGAAIGIGYILLRNPGSAQPTAGPATGPSAVPAAGPTAGPTTATRRYPNQTCDDATLDVLQAEKDRICGAIPGSSCSPSKVSPKKLERMPCSAIRLRIQAMRDCLAARQAIQDQCFGGVPDQAHLDAMTMIQNGINQCLTLEAVNCAPGHPMANL